MPQLAESNCGFDKTARLIYTSVASNRCAKIVICMQIQWNSSLPEINCENVCKATITLTSSKGAIVLSKHLISEDAQWSKAEPHYVTWLQ